MSGQGNQTADVAIIGCGLVGSVAARVLAAAGARVVLVDAGTPMSAMAGTHLRNLPASKLDNGFYRQLGYREAGVIPGYTTDAAGDRRDHVSMYRQLSI